ncbi:hypothetical protein Pint_18044 [Pistacia integerrima]|uniref:Uncharacterized protein n=1 Tax=Pistacia integerrima TaxID=434235 RepID=A0ACC0YVM0_9ROSI|nr:hypothetical protein Pint_18044 [Pistacia integerrima]
MHEYSLDSSLLGPDHYKDYVVCRIRKNQPALKKNKRGKFEEVDSEKKNKRSKVQEVDSESPPLAVLPATISSNTTTTTMVLQPLELDNEGEFYNAEEFDLARQFLNENQHNDSQQFPSINDIF